MVEQVIHGQIVIPTSHPATGQKVAFVSPELVDATADPREVIAVCQVTPGQRPVQTVLSGIHQHLGDQVQQVLR